MTHLPDQIDVPNPLCANRDCTYGKSGLRERSYTARPTWFNPHMLCLNCMDDEQRDKQLDEGAYL